MLKRWIITLTFIPCVIPAGTTSAQSWSDLELDTAFGTDGLATRAFDLGQDNRDVGNAVVRVPGTGQLFTVGAVEGADTGDTIIAVSGLTADGSNDPSFGQNGRVTLDIEIVEGGIDIGRDITVIPWSADSTWRLVVVGDVERETAGDRDFVVALVRPDGSLETTVGGGQGWQTVYFDVGDDDTDVAAAVAIDTQGRIVVGGTVDAAAGDTDWGFARLNPSDLSIDPTFGISGLTVVDVAGMAELHDIAITPGGAIVAVGKRDSGDDQIAVLKLLENGQIDSSFGSGGFVVVDPDLGDGDNDNVFGVDVLPDGRIVFVGQSTQSIDTSFDDVLIIGWLLSDGSPDPSNHGTGDPPFASGSGWIAWTPLWGCSAFQGRAVRALPSGVSGSSHAAFGAVAYCDGNWDYTLLNEDSWDSGGDSGGGILTLVVDFALGPLSDDRLTGIAVQPDGKIVGAGRSTGQYDGLDFSATRATIGDVVFFDGFESSGWWGADWSVTVGESP